MTKQQYTPQTYYKVTQVHAVFFVLGIVFSSLGCHFTRDRVEIEVSKNESTCIHKNETVHGQQTVPYWACGFVLGTINVLLLLLSFGVYRHVTKGIYTEARKKAAKDMDGLYRLLLMPATLWGIGGAVLTGMVGVCSYESDETCYYVYTNFAANKGIAITLIVIHSLWFFTALDFSNLEAPPSATVQSKRGAAPPKLPQSPPKPDAASKKTSQPPPKQDAASKKTSQPPPKPDAASKKTSQPPPKQDATSKKTPQPPPKQVAAASKPPLAPLTTPSSPSTPPSGKLVLPDTSTLPSVAPPSYEEAVSGPYTIVYFEPCPYLQPQHLYSGSAFPDGTPSVAHVSES